MKINYNAIGAKRKELVETLSKELNIPSKYLGPPTFAYGVGGYKVNKDGVLEGEDNPDLVSNLLSLYGFRALAEEYDTPLPEAEPIPDDVQIPYEAELGGRVSPHCGDDEPTAYGIPESNNLVIEMPKTNFTDTALENLKRLIDNKEPLIKKALGVMQLPLEVSEDTVRFPWFADGSEAEKVKTYTHFVTALVDMAKTQKRINTIEKPVENEKYAFRCFLLRLGFIGPEYKQERKILLSNLTGSSAFKSGQRNDEEVAE